MIRSIFALASTLVFSSHQVFLGQNTISASQVLRLGPSEFLTNQYRLPWNFSTIDFPGSSSVLRRLSVLPFL